MMQIKLIFVCAIAILVAGCQGTVEVKKQEQYTQTFAAADFTQAVADKIPLALVVKSGGSDLSEIVTKTKSSLSTYGFILDRTEVRNGKEVKTSSFATAELSGKFEETSNFGGFSKQKGQVSVTLRRSSDKKLIAQNDFDVTGERSKDKFAAKNKVAAELATQLSAWMKEQVFSYSSGLDSVAVSIDFKEFRRAWFKMKTFEDERDEKLALDVTKFTRGAQKRQGILSCQLISTTNEVYSFRFIYLRKDFPNGLVSRSLKSMDVDVQDDDPVDELLDIIINSNVTAK